MRLPDSICHPILSPDDSGMTSDAPKSSAETPVDPVFHKVGENLYRHASGKYYALLKRGGKQFRKSLKCSDRKLAERRLADMRQKIGKLTLSDETSRTLSIVAPLA
jgi:hypothetical protein